MAKSPVRPVIEHPLMPTKRRIGGDKKENPVYIQHKNPKVADHIAKVLIKNNMDYNLAAKEIEPKARGPRIKILAEMFLLSETVQKALAENLAACGLDEASKNTYVTTMWKWMLEGDKSMNEPIFKEDGTRDYRNEARRRDVALQYAITAARILGRAFIQEKPVNNSPVELKIKGWGDLVENLTKPVAGVKEEVEQGNENA